MHIFIATHHPECVRHFLAHLVAQSWTSTHLYTRSTGPRSMRISRHCGNCRHTARIGRRCQDLDARHVQDLSAQRAHRSTQPSTRVPEDPVGTGLCLASVCWGAARPHTGFTPQEVIKPLPVTCSFLSKIGILPAKKNGNELGENSVQTCPAN